MYKMDEKMKWALHLAIDECEFRILDAQTYTEKTKAFRVLRDHVRALFIPEED